MRYALIGVSHNPGCLQTSSADDAERKIVTNLFGGTGSAVTALLAVPRPG